MTSIAPYIPFTDGTVGRGLDPSYAGCNDGNIYHLLHNKKSYVGGGVPDAPCGAYVIACGGQDPSLRTDGKRALISKRVTAHTCGRIWNPPLRWRDAGCLTVVGADSISARRGRRGRRPLRTGFRQAMEGKRDATSSWRADDEHWPLQMRNTSGRGEHCSPVNWAIAQTPAGAHCAPLHPL